MSAVMVVDERQERALSPNRLTGHDFGVTLFPRSRATITVPDAWRRP
jgi:hypothetical protein